MYSKILDKKPFDPEHTKFIFSMGCPKCGEESTEDLRYFDSNLNEFEIKS